jgi:predicted GNAT superfamily acetyltransferase
LSQCVALQREVFALPEIEISPVRHLIVTAHAGGFTLGAFAGDELVGFVLSVSAFSGNERFFYSHMMAVRKTFQSYGIGARLKWAQREEALRRGVDFIKWTFQPVQARNAYLNIEKLGAVVRHYEPNFYGTDYSTSSDGKNSVGLDSDRLFAEWNLNAEKVCCLASGEEFYERSDAAETIEIPNDWNALVKENPERAVAEQLRVKTEFQAAFANGLTGRGFRRSQTNPQYLLFEVEN